MNAWPIIPGSVVVSKAGRDQGRVFAVIQEVDQDFVLVANGKLRTMERLKKKRRKHLKPTGAVIAALCDRLSGGEQIQDHELRAWLREEEEKLVQI